MRDLDELYAGLGMEDDMLRDVVRDVCGGDSNFLSIRVPPVVSFPVSPTDQGRIHQHAKP